MLQANRMGGKTKVISQAEGKNEAIELVEVVEVPEMPLNAETKVT